MQFTNASGNEPLISPQSVKQTGWMKSGKVSLRIIIAGYAESMRVRSKALICAPVFPNDLGARDLIIRLSDGDGGMELEALCERVIGVSYN